MVVTLGVLLGIQISLGVTTIIFLEKMLGSNSYSLKSAKIETRFFFYNFYMLLNNVVCIFYGFVLGANNIGKSLKSNR